MYKRLCLELTAAIQEYLTQIAEEGQESTNSLLPATQRLFAYQLIVDSFANEEFPIEWGIDVQALEKQRNILAYLYDRIGFDFSKYTQCVPELIGKSIGME